MHCLQLLFHSLLKDLSQSLAAYGAAFSSMPLPEVVHER